MKLSQIALVGLVGLAGVAPVAMAQEYPVEATLRYQVWDAGTSTWGSAIFGGINPGEAFQYRAILSYTGPRTDLFALGEILYQTTFGNVDNVGSGVDMDRHGVFRNGGTSTPMAPLFQNSTLTAAEALLPTISNGSGRATGYALTAMTTTSQNVLTQFRHSGGSFGAPAGEYIRIAGSFVSTWPSLTTRNNVLTRGISASQTSSALLPSAHTPGVTNKVIFRGEFVTSSSSLTPRYINISSSPFSLRHAGSSSGTDTRRYMTWQTGPTDIGSYRTRVTFVAANVYVRVHTATTVPCDTIDFNNDGVFPDSQDVADFLSVYSGGPCSTDLPEGPGCNDLDFNNDEVAPDADDIEDIIRACSGEGC